MDMQYTILGRVKIGHTEKGPICHTKHAYIQID